jgi:hypothetical protein
MGAEGTSTTSSANAAPERPQKPEAKRTARRSRQPPEWGWCGSLVLVPEQVPVSTPGRVLTALDRRPRWRGHHGPVSIPSAVRKTSVNIRHHPCRPEALWRVNVQVRKSPESGFHRGCRFEPGLAHVTDEVEPMTSGQWV